MSTQYSIEARAIALIACASQKLSHKARAGDLYTSTLFRRNLEYATLRVPACAGIPSSSYQPNTACLTLTPKWSRTT